MQNNLEGKTVFAIDGHGLLYQNFFAMAEMFSDHSEPVGAVYGFVRDLLGILEQKKPDVLFCALDVHAPTFRSTLYESYKANRTAMPDHLRPQIGFARDIMAALGVPALEMPGFEADDILATITRETILRHGKCVLVTSDKDCRQLLSKDVCLYHLRKQTYYRTENLKADWGILPNQVVDFQALVGDASDNVPGIPLIGPKVAAELLNKYGTLEEIFAHLDEIPQQKRREHLRTGIETAKISRELVKLRDDVPIDIPWQSATRTECLFPQSDRKKTQNILERFGFHSLLPRAMALFSQEKSLQAKQMSLF